MSNPLVGPIVRATLTNAVTIWTEWPQPCEITLTATPTDSLIPLGNPRQNVGAQFIAPISAAPVPIAPGIAPTADISTSAPSPTIASTTSRTITVGGHHYALSKLTDLQPATWYNYRISDSTQDIAPSPPTKSPIIQCFRTLDPPDAQNPLRLAYGSCRKLPEPKPDALSALGDWLMHHIDERDSLWPHLLLLIGDQIYADEYIGRRKQTKLVTRKSKTTQSPIPQSFEDFTRMYVESWTFDEGIRQVFAVLPTYMIFDDHEIRNAWNASPTWRAYALQRGLEQTLVDGLVAYWVYQGWGNIGMQGPDTHPLLAIMQQAVQNSEDALEDLRTCIRRAVYQQTALQWHYDIPTVPPIFVADVRADRPALLDGVDPTDFTPRIMSCEQMRQLLAWMRQHATTTLLVSSVPAILPPVIGFAEYITGVRPFQNASSLLVRHLGQVLAGIQQKFASRMSFDHWPAFVATWHNLVELLDTRKHDLVILSGDVHFSYAMSARRTFFPTRRRSSLYQLVASPFKNALEGRDKRLILGQSWIKRAIYGGFHTRVLPLLHKKGTKHIHFDLLFQNVVSLVTFWPQTHDKGKYHIGQVYMGVKNKTLEEVASTVVNYR